MSLPFFFLKPRGIMDNHEFLKQFAFGGLISLGIGSPKAKDAIYTTLDALPTIPENKDVYFGVAMRKTSGDEKTDVLGSIALWVDVDQSEEKPRWTIPPTYAVFSGHGWHCYWLLDKPCLDPDEIETANKMLTNDLGGDPGCWNVNRVLRVPGTTNTKIADVPVPVEIKYTLGVRYTMDEIFMLKDIPKKTRHKIATGDSRGYRSRSERDWAILTDLVVAGVSDDLIVCLFENQPCGDKHRETGSNHYLLHSLERIRSKNPVKAKTKDGDDDADEHKVEGGTTIVEGVDGYYVPYRKALKRVSTFLLEPTLLLDGSPFGAEDSIVCDVYSDSYTWPAITFNRTVFNSVSKMATATPVAAWQWLGKDEDVKQLLPHLLDKLKKKGLPRVAATKMLGLHKVAGKWLFLGDKQTVGCNDLWQGFEGPLAWTPSKIEHPDMELEVSSDHDVRVLGRLIPQLNELGAIWPMIGWYTAAVLKPWLEQHKYRFPILNVAGTRGSGKSTLIQRVFMPIWGQPNPIAYDSGTTHFVALTLMGGSNAVPVSFSEFRVDAVQRFLRFVLLAYDTGHDARGRADQTTQDYPLVAPFVLDGEDLIDDAAARERIVVVRVHPSTIEEGSPAYNAFKEMEFSMGGVPLMGGTLITLLLKLEASWEDILKRAREAVFVAFPNKLPDRVRNNHIVAYFGILLWCEITQSEPPDATVLSDSISSVFDMQAGRSRTLIDDMIEYVINKANNGGAMYKYTVENGNFYFQLAPAYDDWVAFRRRQGRGVLEKDAMKTQFSESSYQVTSQIVAGVWMFGVRLEAAVQLGLDVPSSMNSREIRISI